MPGRSKAEVKAWMVFELRRRGATPSDLWLCMGTEEDRKETCQVLQRTVQKEQGKGSQGGRECSPAPRFRGFDGPPVGEQKSASKDQSGAGHDILDWLQPDFFLANFRGIGGAPASMDKKLSGYMQPDFLARLLGETQKKKKKKPAAWGRKDAGPDLPDWLQPDFLAKPLPRRDSNRGGVVAENGEETPSASLTCDGVRAERAKVAQLRGEVADFHKEYEDMLTQKGRERGGDNEDDWYEWRLNDDFEDDKASGD